MGLFGFGASKQHSNDDDSSYMIGFRLGFPVDEDEPVTLQVNPNDPEFRRGLTDGVRNFQENRAFLAEHPELF